jgi:hypothetical protein
LGVRRRHHLARARLPDLGPAVTTSAVTGPARVRVCAVLVHDGRLWLIRRQRPAGAGTRCPAAWPRTAKNPRPRCAGNCSRSSASTWRCRPRRRCCASSRTRRPNGRARWSRSGVGTWSSPPTRRTPSGVPFACGPGRAVSCWLVGDSASPHNDVQAALGLLEETVGTFGSAAEHIDKARTLIAPHLN